MRTGDCLQFPTPRGAVLDLRTSGMVRRLKQDDGFVGIDGLCHGMIVQGPHNIFGLYGLYILRNKIRRACLFFPYRYFRIRDCRCFSGINVCSLATDFTRDDLLPGATRKIIAKICCVVHICGGWPVLALPYPLSP